MAFQPERPSLPPPAPAVPGAAAHAGAHSPGVQAELAKSIADLVPGPHEHPPDPNTPVGLHWRIFDVTSNWLILVLAIVNLSLVFFDYTYIDLRHVYQANGWGQLVTSYDKVKGIEPHRATNKYVLTANETFRLLASDPTSPDAQAALSEMQDLSQALMKEDPFLAAGLRGVSEQLKAKFRKHEWLRTATYEQKARWERRFSYERMHAVATLHHRPWDDMSVTKAMIGSQAAAAARGTTSTDNPAQLGFWSPENLSPNRLHDEELWFKAEVQPLLDRNYWQTYDEDGEPADRFWIIDCFFLPIFLGEFLIRGILGVKRKVYPNFQTFFATRWYDAVYFLPVVVYALPPTLQGPLHLVRMVSVGARMERLGLINPVAIVQARVARLLDHITDIVNVKLLSNYQDGVRAFDLEQSMNTLTPIQRQQLQTLIENNMKMVVGKVVPDIMDEVERLITRSAAQALERAPAYNQFKQLPFFGGLPEQLIGRLVTETITQSQMTMLKTLSDPENVRLTNELIQAITESLLRHMAEVGTEDQVKAMLIDLLEEQKRRLVADENEA